MNIKFMHLTFIKKYMNEEDFLVIILLWLTLGPKPPKTLGRILRGHHTHAFNFPQINMVGEKNIF